MWFFFQYRMLTLRLKFEVPVTGLDPFSSVSFIRLLIVYGNVGHIMLGVGEKLEISRHCAEIALFREKLRI